MSINNYITNNIKIEFTSSPAWIAAITQITIDGAIISSDDYTTADTYIEFTRDLFNRANDFAIVITATGYDDASVTQTITVCLWDNLTLYVYTDIIAREPDFLADITALTAKYNK